MKNIIDYVNSETRSFMEKEFSPVDSLILSQIAYMRFDGVVPDLSKGVSFIPVRQVAAMGSLDTLFRGVRSNRNNQQLFEAFVNSPRFCDTVLAFYRNQLDEETEKQFSAITFFLVDGSTYIAFRGTDSTITGWKEDFNMAFTSPIPSQKEGVDYLNAVAGRTSGTLRERWPLQGGNIAVYSAINCAPLAQKRIEQIYSHDGPGFRGEILQSAGYLMIEDRINKNLPQSSIIGMLLHNQELYSVVKSNRIWVMQHDPFSWLIDGDDFLYLPSISKSATYMHATLDQWMNLYDDQKRKLFINTLFQIFQATEANTVYDLTGDWHKRAVAALGALREIDEETRSFVLQTIGSLFILAIKNIRETSIDR